MGLLNDAEEIFGTSDLYEIFSLKQKANEKESKISLGFSKLAGNLIIYHDHCVVYFSVKKAYYKLSLKVHPDKVDENEKEEASKKFQVLSRAFYILSDKEKQAVYDETGSVGEDDAEISDKGDWTAYFRTMFPKVTVKDLDAHMEKYIGSEEEKTELRDLYLKHKGDLNSISECMMYYNFENEPRYKEMINDMIENEEIPPFDAFVKESKISAMKRKRKVKITCIIGFVE